MSAGALDVTALSSIDAVQRESATFAVLSEVPRVVVVRHDLSQADSTGVMRRVVSDSGGVVEDEALPIEHACLGCALREDLLPTLVRLGETGRWDAALLALPVAGEPLPVVRGMLGGLIGHRPVSRRLRLTGVVCVIDADSFDHDLFGDDLLADRGLAHSFDDRRAVGEVLAHQVEQADLVLASGLQESPTASDLLRHLMAPASRLLPGPHEVSGRELLRVGAEPSAMLSRADPRAIRPSGVCDTDCVWTLDLQSWRPLHPTRLQAEIELLASGRVRSRGRFWLPGRPATVAAWDGAGSQLSMGDVGSWRSTERSTRLVMTGTDREDRTQIAEAFERVLLTDAELARGRDWWVGRDDGFDLWLGERGSAA